jgi:hypothetical protein
MISELLNVDGAADSVDDIAFMLRTDDLHGLFMQALNFSSVVDSFGFSYSGRLIPHRSLRILHFVDKLVLVVRADVCCPKLCDSSLVSDTSTWTLLVSMQVFVHRKPQDGAVKSLTSTSRCCVRRSR